MNSWYNERALLMIENYIYHLRKPRAENRPAVFAHLSYSIWAAEELLEYVKKHDSNPPLDSVNNFIKLMDEYSCTNSETSRIFSTASDIAKDIFDMLLTYL